MLTGPKYVLLLSCIVPPNSTNKSPVLVPPVFIGKIAKISVDVGAFAKVDRIHKQRSFC